MKSFNWLVIDQIQKAIKDARITDAELIRRSGFKRNTFYVKMRGETPLTTDDIVRLVEPLGLTPEIVFERAADSNQGQTVAAESNLATAEESELRSRYQLAANTDSEATEDEPN